MNVRRRTNSNSFTTQRSNDAVTAHKMPAPKRATTSLSEAATLAPEVGSPETSSIVSSKGTSRNSNDEGCDSSTKDWDSGDELRLIGIVEEVGNDDPRQTLSPKGKEITTMVDCAANEALYGNIAISWPEWLREKFQEALDGSVVRLEEMKFGTVLDLILRWLQEEVSPTPQ
ncbi:hypothetical protein BDZ91DRAFT_362319 [Kalaharituber pfeilii]|nr:hypothetical protein BDZ91DRAFT_362319 [Kalaharituber pfeilii]